MEQNIENLIVQNGFFIPVMSLYDLHDKVMEFREIMQPMAHDKLCKIVGEISASVYDNSKLKTNAHLCFAGSGQSSFDLARQMFFDEKTGVLLADSIQGLKMSVFFYPIKDKILGVAYCDKQEWVKMWMEQDFIHEYGYDESKDADLLERKDDWCSLFKHFNGSASLNSFIVELTDPRVETITVEEAGKNIPHFLDRLRTLTETQMISFYGNKFSWNGDFQTFMNWCGSEEGKRQAKKIEDMTYTKIKQELKREDIEEVL